MTLAATLAGALAALSACGPAGKDKDANWLTVPTPASHASYYPIAGTPHDPTAPGAVISCSSCHSGATFTTFVCVGCHTPAETDPIHLPGIPGYASPPTSQDCFACHKDGAATMAPEAHAQFFPIGTTSHPASCVSCHAAGASKGDLSALACATCHETRPGFGTAHAAVDGYPQSPTGADCLACHDGSLVHRIADHQARFPIAAGSATHDTACLDCHTGPRADKAWAADFGAFACVACHTSPETDATHTGITGYAHQSSACYQCHPQGTAASVDHARFFPVGTGTAHDGVACAQCHTDPARRQDPATLACASCHQTQAGFGTAHTVTGHAILVVHTSQNASTPVALTSPNCLRCHADGQVDLVSAHPAGDQGFGQGDHRRAGCVTCHTAMRTGTKSFGASWDSATGCTTCHRNGIPN